MSDSSQQSVDSNDNEQIDWADNASYAYGMQWSNLDGVPAGFSDGTDNYLPSHPATSNVDMNGNRISNLADPNNAQDAATKSYVDSASGANPHNCHTIEEEGTTPWLVCSGNEVITEMELIFLDSTSDCDGWTPDVSPKDAESVCLKVTCCDI